MDKTMATLVAPSLVGNRIARPFAHARRQRHLKLGERREAFKPKKTSGMNCRSLASHLFATSPIAPPRSVTVPRNKSG